MQQCIDLRSVGMLDNTHRSSGPLAGMLSMNLHMERPLILCEVTAIGRAQALSRMPLREVIEVAAVSAPEQPLVQLMLPAAQKLAAQAPGGTAVGAPAWEQLQEIQCARKKLWGSCSRARALPTVLPPCLLANIFPLWQPSRPRAFCRQAPCRRGSKSVLLFVANARSCWLPKAGSSVQVSSGRLRSRARARTAARSRRASSSRSTRMCAGPRARRWARTARPCWRACRRARPIKNPAGCLKQPFSSICAVSVAQVVYHHCHDKPCFFYV